MFFLDGTIPWQEFIISLVILGAFSYWIFRHYGLSAAALTAWIGLSCIRLLNMSFSPYKTEFPEWRTSFALGGAYSLLLIVAILFFVRFFERRYLSICFQILAGINALLLFGIYREGILFNASMSGCFNACVFPLFIQYNKKIPPLSLIVPLSVFATCKNLPIATLFVVLGVFLLHSKHYKTMLLALCSSFVAGHFLVGHMFLKDEGRSQVWYEAARFIHSHGNIWLGNGTGSFYYIGPYITSDKFGMAWMWMHNDWFQIFLENGLVGLLLSLAVFGVAVYRSWFISNRLCASIIGFGFFGIANFPLHDFISAIFGAFIIEQALRLSTATLQAKKNKRRSNCQASPQKHKRPCAQSFEEYKLGSRLLDFVFSIPEQPQSR